MKRSRIFLSFLILRLCNDYKLIVQIITFRFRISIFFFLQYKRYFRSSAVEISRISLASCFHAGKKHDQKILNLFIPISIREITLRAIRCCERSTTHAKQHFGWKNRRAAIRVSNPFDFQGYRSCLKVDLVEQFNASPWLTSERQRAQTVI